MARMNGVEYTVMVEPGRQNSIAYYAIKAGQKTDINYFATTVTQLKPMADVRTRKIGDVTILEFKTREEAIAYAESLAHYRETLRLIAIAESQGLISPN